MRAVRVNQNSKVVGCENQNNELKDAKMPRRAEGDSSRLIILCEFTTMSDTFQITHLAHKVKILISAALRLHLLAIPINHHGYSQYKLGITLAFLIVGFTVGFNFLLGLLCYATFYFGNTCISYCELCILDLRLKKQV